MNTALLDATLDFILTQPDRWDQRQWVRGRNMRDVPESMKAKLEVGANAACGTTGCLAGNALLLSPNYEARIAYVLKNLSGEPTGYAVDTYHVRTNQQVRDSEWTVLAAQELDLDEHLAYRLFHMTEVGVTPEHFVAWVRAQISAWPERLLLDQVEGYENVTCTAYDDHDSEDCEWFDT
jgi:hypothetical protein